MGIVDRIGEIISAHEDEQTIVCPNCSRIAEFSDIIEKRGAICCRSCLYARTKGPKYKSVWPRADVSTFVTSSAASDDMILNISQLPNGTAA